MSNSPLLALPYLAASQAQKHVTVNEALSLVDGLLHLSVITRALATPPASPMDGDRYMVAGSPTGAWVGHAAQIALRMEGAWRFLNPRTGWRVWIADENLLLVFNGTIWLSPAVPTALQNLALLGVNTSADATNRLAVNSAAVLFNNVGAGVQFKVNKATAADTASLLFQTGFSGRAEIGLSGDDDFHFKVSASGSSFNESLIVASASGLVTAKNNIVLDPQSTDPATPSNGQLWYNSTSGKFRGRQSGVNLDLISVGGVSSSPPAMLYAFKTSAYTIVAGDRGKTIDVGSNAVTLALDATATLGDGFYFFTKNSNSSAANYLTLDPNGTETIDGFATLVDPPGIERIVFSDGVQWRTKIIAGANIDPVYTPPAIAANTDNYDPQVKGVSGTVRLSASAALQITGLVGGAQGARRVLTNVGMLDILLKNENAASSAANRFTLPFGSFILGAAKSIEFTYDVASQRWRPTTQPDGRSIVYLPTDVINNSATANTLADVSGLSFPVVAGQAYRFKFTISYDAAAVTTGSRWTLAGPATTQLKYVSRYSVTATADTVINAIVYSVPAACNASSANTSQNSAVIEGTITPSANGTVIARFASEVLSSAITAKAAVSFVEYEAIGN